MLSPPGPPDGCAPEEPQVEEPDEESLPPPKPPDDWAPSELDEPLDPEPVVAVPEGKAPSDPEEELPDGVACSEEVYEAEAPDEAAEEEEEVEEEEATESVTDSVLKSQPGMEMVPTVKVVSSSEVMVASTPWPRDRVLA